MQEMETQNQAFSDMMRLLASDTFYDPEASLVWPDHTFNSEEKQQKQPSSNELASLIDEIENDKNDDEDADKNFESLFEGFPLQSETRVVSSLPSATTEPHHFALPGELPSDVLQQARDFVPEEADFDEPFAIDQTLEQDTETQAMDPSLFSVEIPSVERLEPVEDVGVETAIVRSTVADPDDWKTASNMVNALQSDISDAVKLMRKIEKRQGILADYLASKMSKKAS